MRASTRSRTRKPSVATRRGRHSRPMRRITESASRSEHMTKSKIIVATVGLFISIVALADTTLTYRSEGGCVGDFDRFELKSTSMRVDGGGANGSMIYDHAEKLAYFI